MYSCDNSIQSTKSDLTSLQYWCISIELSAFLSIEIQIAFLFKFLLHFSLLKWDIGMRCVSLITTWNLKFNSMYVRQGLLFTTPVKADCKITVQPRLAEQDRKGRGRRTFRFSQSLNERPCISYKLWCTPAWKYDRHFK